MNKLLIVDDEESVRSIFADLLKRRNFSVTSVGSAEEALGLVEKENYEIVLLDIKLPGISGIEALRQIKLKKPKTIVIMITGFSYDEELIAKSKELGCDGYIGKNLPIEQVMNNLDLFINATKERLKRNKQ